MKSTEQDWDEVRKAFSSSIMVDTSLNSLAQNLDGPEWPILDDTPANYIDLSFAEMRELLAIKGHPPEQGDALIGILKETLAFDNPFGEMVEQNEVAAQRDNQLLKNMAKLEIPQEFPIDLVALSPDTREFCQHENITTLATLAVFAQGMSQTVIVGGDFRKLLNSLSHVDESGIAEVLPFRPGSTGLHLVEALALATQSPDPAGQAAKAVEWFQDEFAALKADARDRNEFARNFAVLGNPELEAAAIELLRPHMKVPAVASRGMFGSLSRLFGR
ncbi:MAG TPA: hypothetical protein VHO24_00785 [Opitutaceae bacterium]|nr:hypothetical protein [Opitutaceae bacterium]